MHEVEFHEVGPPDVEVTALQHAVVILPQRADGVRGIYRDEQLTLAKELWAEGVDAAYLHDADHRAWHGLRGDALLIPIVLGLSTSIVGGGAVAAIGAVLRRRFRPDARLTMKVGHFKDSDSGVDQRWFEATGSAEDVISAFERFEQRLDP